MRKELRKNQKLSYTLIYLLMVFSLANVLGDVLLVDLNVFGRLLISMIISLIVQFFVLRPMYFFITFGASIVGMLIFNKFNQAAVIRVLLWLQQFYKNVNNHFKGTEELLLKNTRLLWIIFVILLSIYTVIILFKTKHSYLLLPLYLLFFGYYWYIYIDISYYMMAFFLMLYIIFLGFSGFFKSKENWKRTKAKYNNTMYALWSRTAITYGLIIILLSGIIPKGGAVVDWYWLESQVQSRFPILLELRDDLVYSRSFGQPDMFDLSQTGFQSNGNELGGPVIPNESLVMKVEAPYPLYLRGNVKSLYSHNNWEKRIVRQRSYNTVKVLPTDVVYGERVTVGITLENMATYTVFAPFQLVKINDSNVHKVKIDENDQATFYGAKYKGESYEVRAKIPSTRISFNEEISLEDYSDYLQLPDNLSPSIVELGNEITKNARSKYEKAILIRDYLRENYEYSLNPSHTPSGEEFLEYFLMDEKKGYCTYYATAMAILLRTQGIPSRYIEGYRLPEERVNGVYEVRQRNAHAWVEAYMGNGSWITFEPTPAFEISTFQDFEIESQTVSDELAQTDNIDELGTDKDLNGQLGGGFSDIIIDDSLGNYSYSPARSTLSTIWDHLSTGLSIALLVLLFGIVPLRIIFSYFRIRRYFERLKETKDSNKVLYLYQNTLQLLEELDYGILQGETEYEYAHRITNKLYDFRHYFRDFTDSYVRAKYGQEQLTDEELKFAFEYLKSIERKVRYKKGIFKYYYIKYIKGKLYNCYKVNEETLAYL